MGIQRMQHNSWRRSLSARWAGLRVCVSVKFLLLLPRPYMDSGAREDINPRAVDPAPLLSTIYCRTKDKETRGMCLALKDKQSCVSFIEIITTIAWEKKVNNSPVSMCEGNDRGCFVVQLYTSFIRQRPSRWTRNKRSHRFCQKLHVPNWAQYTLKMGYCALLSPDDM